MKILVLNSGSSSLKFQLFELFSVTQNSYQLLASGLIEKIAEAHSRVTLDYIDSYKQNKKYQQKINISNHAQALELMISLLKDKHCISSMKELKGIGHRIVHGGEQFKQAVIINQQVIKHIEQLIPLAPLHNPANLSGIKLAQEKAADIPQVAVFDTSFHQTIPQYAYIYALPYHLYEQHHIRRYGFHGTSHHYVAKQADHYLQQSAATAEAPKPLKLITIHLGNGASACAINNGQSVDTSMGMTPLEGLVMGTRSGNIDPAILFYLQQKTAMTLTQINDMLNQKSGLKGICGDNDMRNIISRAEQGNHQAELAIHIFCYHIKKYIGAYLAVLNGADAIIFTGGIGENSALIRDYICQDMHHLGINIHADKNHQKNSNILEIQNTDSKIKILVIHTNEELEIAQQTALLVEKITRCN